MIVLETRNLEKTFHTRRWGKKSCVRAVDGVSIRVEAGKCTALVGESGCGKSTLGRLIIGSERQDAGEILFHGRPRGKKLTREERRQIQVVSQDSMDAVNPRFTAEEIISQPLKNFFCLRGKECSARVDRLLADVAIDVDEKGKYPLQFSGGQLQRICIARALASEPELIVLDEPLSSLDVSVQAQILNLLQDLKEEKGVSYLMISHDLEAVYYLSDRIYIMFQGQIMESLEDMSLFDKLDHPYSRRLLFASDSGEGCVCRQDREEGEKKEESKGETMQTAFKGCSYSFHCPYAEDICFCRRPELREVESGHRIACHIKER